MTEPWTLRPIGVIRSIYKDKFGIPRQAGLAPSAASRVLLDAEVCPPAALRGLDGFSHVWIVFGFHEAHAERLTVRPPRLAAARLSGEAVPARVGVFATRSPHRPNRLGLSAVRLVGVDSGHLDLLGGDFLDGTPVFDVKPYLPYADALPDARADWASAPLARSPVSWTDHARALAAPHPGLVPLVEESLSLDPRRPGARDGTYGMRVGAWDVKCFVSGGEWLVTDIVEVEHAPLPAHRTA